MDATATASQLAEAAKELADCSRVAVFDQNGTVLHASCKVRPPSPARTRLTDQRWPSAPG